MGNGSGVSRGDRNRNARLARLRALVRPEFAIVGIDLADRKQMVVVTDHNSQVLARRTFRCAAWELGAALDWAAEQASRAGYEGVTVVKGHGPSVPQRHGLHLCRPLRSGTRPGRPGRTPT